MAKKETTPEVEAIPSIGGDVTPVFIDNTDRKQTPEWEKRYNEAVKSGKEQRKAARKAEKDAAEKSAKKGKK